MKTTTTTTTRVITIHDVTIPWQANRQAERERAIALMSKIQAAGGSLEIEITETVVDLDSIDLDL